MKQPVGYLRLEGAAILAAGLLFYFYRDFPVVWFVVLLLAVDVFMAGYLVNKRLGAHLYNIGHSLTLPLLLFGVALLADVRWLEGLSYIWMAHIGMDRLFGYGLKYSSGFKDTTLGPIGKK